MGRCYLCSKEFKPTEEGAAVGHFSGKVSVTNRMIWKDMLLTVTVQDKNAQSVSLCSPCLRGALERAAKFLTQEPLLMTAEGGFVITDLP